MSEWTPYGEALALVRLRLSLDEAAASDLLLNAIDDDQHVLSRIRPDEMVEAMDGQALYERERDLLLKFLTDRPLTPERKLYPFTIDVLRASFDDWTAGLLNPHHKAEPQILETGLPGAPEKGRTYILREFDRRREAGETLDSLAGEVRAILNWFAKAHPDAERPLPTSTENLLRKRFREAIKQGI
ncbi:hypothetical protein NKI50_01785 [Mesorhizobium sp. M0563]|uniref:hypothetical protein n=1 Tax=Mesorhizobium sp. M0563 TaxID=2956959 RepID=UPI00333B402B